MTAEEMVRAFLRHRKITEQFCTIMPDEHFGFKPYEGAMSFGGLVLHIVVSGDFYLSLAEGIPMTRPDPETAPKTPAQIRAHLAAKSAEQAERIGKLGDDPNRELSMKGKPITLGTLMGQQREHEAHHKGQLMMMLRMCGVRDDLFYSVR